MIQLSDLPRMAVFAVVVREGSFTAAARRLGLSKASISEHLRKLEASVGARLLQRTTRRVSLTEVGEAYYRSCEQILEEAESANAAVGAMQSEPSGSLRVTAPPHLGPSYVIPALIVFSRAYPKVLVDLILSDTRLDLLEHKIDAAIRTGWPEESSLISRKLATMPQYLCASPEYIARTGQPTKLSELGDHNWITLTILPQKRISTLQSPSGGQRAVTARGNTVTNTAESLHAFVLSGHGIGVLPALMVEEDLKSGRLVRLLADHVLPEGGIYALFPSRHHLSPKVTRFIEILGEAWPASAPQHRESQAHSRSARRTPPGH